MRGPCRFGSNIRFIDLSRDGSTSFTWRRCWARTRAFLHWQRKICPEQIDFFPWLRPAVRQGLRAMGKVEAFSPFLNLQFHLSAVDSSPSPPVSPRQPPRFLKKVSRKREILCVVIPTGLQPRVCESGSSAFALAVQEGRRPPEPAITSAQAASCRPRATRLWDRRIYRASGA